MTSKLTHEDIIRRMFVINDTSNWEALYQIFTSDIIYCRPGQDILQGVDNVITWFKKERPVASGIHHIHKISVLDENLYCVLGWFNGKLKDNTVFTVGFFDLIKLNNEKICLRKTYLDNQPYDHIGSELATFIR